MRGEEATGIKANSGTEKKNFRNVKTKSYFKKEQGDCKSREPYDPHKTMEKYSNTFTHTYTHPG